MRLNEEQQTALMIEANRLVEEHADRAAKMLCGVDEVEGLAYPPNHGLTAEELRALENLRRHPEAVGAARKIVADAVAAAFFHFFGLIDAVGDPLDYDGDWFPITLHMPMDDFEDEPQDLDPYEIAFSDAYWKWRAKRPDPGWKLDTWEGPDPIQ